MRTDQKLARKSFRHSEEWQRTEDGAPLTPQIDRRLKGGVSEDGRYLVHSLSGGERNHFFANVGDGAFEDRSAISGLDNPADARGFVLFDYDRDGRQDIALVNANAPLFNLYRNTIEAVGKVIALRFVGSAGRLGGEGKTARDGYGALVVAELSDGVMIKREHRCGEGFASQNSATMLIGIGGAERVATLSVHWPSGRVTVVGEIAAGELVTVREEAGATTSEPYLRAAGAKLAKSAKGEVFALAAAEASDAKLKVYTTTATWCAACLEHLPEINAMVESFGKEGVEFIGVPVDEDDDVEKLGTYVDKWKPRYRMLAELPVAERRKVTAFFRERSGAENVPLPSSVVTDGAGRVLQVISGIPSVSDLRRWLASR